eukprot:12037875-Alexandrium_andersonii.AAC.1
MLLRHFGQDAMDDILTDVLYQSSQFWARVEVPMLSWPRQLIDSGADPETLGSFYAAPGCCLDESFAEPLPRAIRRNEWAGRTSSRNRRFLSFCVLWWWWWR